MKPVRKIKILVLFLFLFIFACSSKNEIEVEKLAKIYVDLLIVEETFNDNDSLNLKREEVFSKYSITEEIYDSSFKMFEYDDEKWDKFFNLSNEYLDTLKANVKSSETPR